MWEDYGKKEKKSWKWYRGRKSKPYLVKIWLLKYEKEKLDEKNKNPDRLINLEINNKR